MKLAALVFLTVPTLSAGTLVFLTSPQAAELKSHPDARFTSVLRSRADAALKQGPWTVASERPSGLKLRPTNTTAKPPTTGPTPRIPAKSRHGLHCSCCDLDAFATLCRRRFSKAVHDKMKPPSDVGRVS